MNNSLQAVLFSVLILSWFVDLLAEILNQRSFSVEVPEEFKGVYDPQKYRSAIFYQREKSRFGILASGIQLGALLVFWSSGGFEKVDLASRSLANSPWVMALVFGGILSVLKSVLQLPFSIYDTFVLEAMYGFNRTTPLTFVSDHLKGALLGALLGGAAYLGVIWFFDRTGTQAWLWAWAAFTLFQILLLFLAPAVLMPLFNKFEPLENGPLRDAIGAYARGQDFQLQGIFKMDGSKRSTKANAFFTGFGRFRRLVLFDTLIEKNTIEELVAVLAH
ncbi:MAG: M48 family metallopeptidase, partial [Bdellovibrionota bacterium]